MTFFVEETAELSKEKVDASSFFLKMRNCLTDYIIIGNK